MITRVPFNYNARGLSALDRRESLKDFARVMQTKRGRARFSSDPDLLERRLIESGRVQSHAASRWLYGNSYPQLFAVLTAQALSAGDLCCKTSTTTEAIIRAQDVTYASAVNTPSAPTVADAGVNIGTPLTNAATGVKISYQFPWGEGPLSSAGSATPTGGAALLVSGSPLAPASPAMYTNIYVETAAGSGTYKLWGTTATGASVLVNSYGAGQSPPGTTYAGSALVVTQYNFAQLFVGQSASYKDANVALIAGYGTANLVRMDTSGVYYADLDTSYTWLAGDYFAPAVNGGGTALQSQTLMPVASAGSSGPVSYATNSGLARLSTHVAVQAGSSQSYAFLQLDTVIAKRQR